MADSNRAARLGDIIRQQRLNARLTLQELAAQSSVSASHLGRIERGERFPSARILRRLAKPLGLEENEIFTLAGYLSPQGASVAEGRREYGQGQLVPYVAKMLAQEPPEVQNAVIGILTILKNIAKVMARENPPG